MSHVHSVSDRAELVVERYALARKRATLTPHSKDACVELVAAYDELVTYIAGLEAMVALLSTEGA